MGPSLRGKVINMARKRSIKPNFNDDDDICVLSFGARLLYIGLWGHMDRHGLIEDSPRSIRSKIFPREDHPMEAIQGWLDELLRPGPSGRPRLIRLEWNGRVLLYCPTFVKHQRIYSDEPSLFGVPPDVLNRAMEEAYSRSICSTRSSGAVPARETPGIPPATARGPRMSRASSSPSTSTSASASAPASTLTEPHRVVDNPASERENSVEPAPTRIIPRPQREPGAGAQSGAGKVACALCGGRGTLRRQSLEDGLPYDFRCACPIGEKAGSDRWSRWTSELAARYGPYEPRRHAEGKS